MCIRDRYTVTPDVRRPYSMEVFSIDEVSSISSTNQKITSYEPFYSLRHSARKEDRACFWLARRRASSRANDEGTEMALSLVDLSTANVETGASVLSVRTTCTNRDLPSRLPFGNQDSDFEMEGTAAMKRIVALRKPTQPARPEPVSYTHLDVYKRQVFDKIKEARRKDDELAQGDWQSERKTANYPLVIKLAQDTLATVSKDLQLAAWLTEALLMTERYGGLCQGITLCHGLLTKFWDTVYPVIEDGDRELRAKPLSWIGSMLDFPLRSALSLIHI